MFVTDDVVVRNNQIDVTARPIQTLICDGNVQLQGSNLPTGCTGQWTITSGSGVIDDASAARVNVSNLVQGETKFIWTVTQNGCDSKAETSVINNMPDAPAITIVNGTNRIRFTESEYLTNGTYRYVICDDKIYLEADPISTQVFANQSLEWSRVTGGGKLAPNTVAQSITLTDLTKGDNIYKLTISNGSCSRTIMVNIFNAQLKVSAGYDDYTKCEDSYKLDASELPNANTFGYWTYSADSRVTFENASDPNTKITNIKRGANTLTWTVNQEGCESSASVVITSNHVTQATTQSSLTVCDGATAFTGNKVDDAHETGVWKILEGFADLTDINDPNTQATNFDRGRNVFRWLITAKDGGCSSYSDQIVNNNAIDVNAGLDTAVCQTTTTLRAVTPLTNGTWTVKAGNGFGTIANPDSPVTQVGGLNYGANVFVWTVTQKGCSSSDEVTVYNNIPKITDPQSIRIAGPDQDKLVKQTTTMADVGVVDRFGQGTWSLKYGGCDPIADIHNPNAIITGLGQGTKHIYLDR